MTILQFPVERMERHYIDAADVAKLLRVRLKKEFPGVKFGVTTDKYSGGASIRVRWTDGPKGKQVEAITNQYEGATFDGMQDLKSYVDMDQAIREHHPELPAGRLKGCADYIFAERTLSPATKQAIADELGKKWGFEAPADQGTWHGVFIHALNEYLGTLIHQASSDPARFLLEEAV